MADRIIELPAGAIGNHPAIQIRVTGDRWEVEETINDYAPVYTTSSDNILEVKQRKIRYELDRGTRGRVERWELTSAAVRSGETQQAISGGWL